MISTLLRVEKKLNQFIYRCSYSNVIFPLSNDK